MLLTISFSYLRQVLALTGLYYSPTSGPYVYNTPMSDTFNYDKKASKCTEHKTNMKL